MTVTTLTKRKRTLAMTLTPKLRSMQGKEYIAFTTDTGEYVLVKKIPYKFADSAPGSEYEEEEPISFFESEIGE